MFTGRNRKEFHFIRNPKCISHFMKPGSMPYNPAGWSVARTLRTSFQVPQDLYQDLNKLKRGIPRSNFYLQGRQCSEVLPSKVPLRYLYVLCLQGKNFLKQHWVLLQVQWMMFLWLRTMPSIVIAPKSCSTAWPVHCTLCVQCPWGLKISIKRSIKSCTCRHRLFFCKEK